MSEKSEWQEANRDLIAEERWKLGDPPTAEEMLAFRRGELPESEEERIRDLLLAYPELARMYAAPVPEAPRPGDPDHVSDGAVAAGWSVLQQRLGRGSSVWRQAREESRRGRAFFHYLPAGVAAAVALVCFVLFVQAESRARYWAQQEKLPRILGAPQELDPDGSRGPTVGTMLRKDGEAYLLKPRLINQVRYPHYHLELHDERGRVLWTNRTAQADEDDAFQIVVPHSFLSEGENYRLVIYGVDGETRTAIGSYDLSLPVE